MCMCSVIECHLILKLARPRQRIDLLKKNIPTVEWWIQFMTKTADSFILTIFPKLRWYSLWTIVMLSFAWRRAHSLHAGIIIYFAFLQYNQFCVTSYDCDCACTLNTVHWIPLPNASIQISINWKLVAIIIIVLNFWFFPSIYCDWKWLNLFNYNWGTHIFK